jgi:hypothetical protein
VAGVDVAEAIKMDKGKRSSSKLERVPSPLQMGTRTRSALSFDIDNATSDERQSTETGRQTQQDSKGPAAEKQASSTDAPRSGISSRLSRKFLFNTKSDGSTSESAGDSSREASPKRSSSRGLFTMRAGGGDDSTVKNVDSPKGDRKSRGFFSPKSLSLLRISTKASDYAQAQDEEETTGAANGVVQSEAASSGSTLFATTDSTDSSGSPSAAVRSARFFRKSAPPIKLPDDMDPQLLDELELVLSDRDKRDRLVEHLLAEHVDGGSAKVRFMSAVGEYDRTVAKSEKALKGKKIVSTFLQRDAPFPLQGLPREVLAAASVDTFPLLRVRVAIDLLSNPTTAAVVKQLAYEVEDVLATSGDLG